MPIFVIVVLVIGVREAVHRGPHAPYANQPHPQSPADGEAFLNPPQVKVRPVRALRFFCFFLVREVAHPHDDGEEREERGKPAVW